MRTNPSTRARALPAYRNQFFSISGFFYLSNVLYLSRVIKHHPQMLRFICLIWLLGFCFIQSFFSPIIHHNSLLCSIAFTHSFLPFLYLSQSILDLNKILMLSFGNHIYPQTSSNEKRNPSQPKKNLSIESIR